MVTPNQNAANNGGSMRTKLRLAALSGLSGMLLMGAVACGGDDHGPSHDGSDICDALALDDCTEPVAPVDPDLVDPDQVDPDLVDPDQVDPDQVDPVDPVAPDPVTSCAFPGDYLCDDTPIKIPPPDLGSWS